MKVEKEEPIEIIEEQQQRKEVKFLGSQRKIPGLTLWEFNWKTGHLAPVSFKKEDVALTSLKETESSSIKHAKVEVHEHCWYFQALNRDNATKKVNRVLNNLSSKA